jgi:hypothetical protein
MGYVHPLFLTRLLVSLFGTVNVPTQFFVWYDGCCHHVFCLVGWQTWISWIYHGEVTSYFHNRDTTLNDTKSKITKVNN